MASRTAKISPADRNLHVEEPSRPGTIGCTGDLGELTAAAVNLVRSGLAPLS